MPNYDEFAIEFNCIKRELLKRYTCLGSNKNASFWGYSAPFMPWKGLVMTFQLDAHFHSKGGGLLIVLKRLWLLSRRRNPTQINQPKN